MRQRYAMSVRRHALGSIQEEDEKEPQVDDLNSNNHHIEALSEVVIENKVSFAREKESPIRNKNNGIEMRTPERKARTLERNKLEVSCTKYLKTLPLESFPVSIKGIHGYGSNIQVPCTWRFYLYETRFSGKSLTQLS